MYINKTELQYHMILSQGKGKPTEKFLIMLYKICKELGGAINNIHHNSNDDHEDCYHHSFSVNYYCYQKYKTWFDPFVYVTECVKRGYTQGSYLNKYGKKYVPECALESTFLSLSGTWVI